METRSASAASASARDRSSSMENAVTPTTLPALRRAIREATIADGQQQPVQRLQPGRPALAELTGGDRLGDGAVRGVRQVGAAAGALGGDRREVGERGEDAVGVHMAESE